VHGLLLMFRADNRLNFPGFSRVLRVSFSWAQGSCELLVFGRIAMKTQERKVL